MNKLVITIAGLLLSLQVNAQVFKSLGFKGGITVTNFSEWNPSDSTINKFYTKAPESRILVNIALFAEGLSTKYFSTVGEIAYNPKGVSFSYPMLNGNGNVIGEESIDNRIGYISLMLCEKARVNWNKMNLYVFAGPRVDMQLNSNTDRDFDETYRKFNSMIFGATTGLGVEFYDRNFKIITEFQYEPDIAYTLDNSYGKVKKNTWLLRVGFGLNAGK
ncbi:MAG: outer membrane beta-barrel protein [Ignavibacteria bacterium]